MTRFLIFVACLVSVWAGSASANVWPYVNNNLIDPTKKVPALNEFVDPMGFKTMHPLMSNKMRVALNPGVDMSTSHNPVRAYMRTDADYVRATANPRARRIVPRGTSTTTARTASAATVAPTTARAGTTSAATATSGQNNADARRVVARGNFAQNATVRNSGRTDASTTVSRGGTNAITSTTTNPLPADRCLADYTECMNSYCVRKDMPYNRCYCSSRLAQIDAEYRPAIDNLINQLLTLGSNNSWTPAEMNEYWDKKVGQYTGDNSWTNLDNALDINWADTESRVRGQQAFVTGHEYCAQHLRGCFYMASNMRDAYRSEIARDCGVYETALQRIKNAAESMIQSYSE